MKGIKTKRVFFVSALIGSLMLIPLFGYSQEEEELPQIRTINRTLSKTSPVIMSASQYKNWSYLKTQVKSHSLYSMISSDGGGSAISLGYVLDEVDKIFLQLKDSQKTILSDARMASRLSANLSIYKTKMEIYEDRLQTVGDDSQINNINLQIAGQQQAKMMQLLSNIMKMMNDTKMSIINNMK